MDDRLRQQLDSLRTDLASNASLDADSRAAAQKLLDDVARVIQSKSPPGAPQSITDRLESLAVRFETDHPSLGAGLREITDLLLKVGI